MGRKYKLFLLGVSLVGIVLLAALFARVSGADILNPAGQIAQKEFNLLVFATLLMLVIVVPVFVMTFMISWKYREGNQKKTKYQPNWDGSKLYETIWWGFPLLIIGILSFVTWQSSHELDPFKPIKAEAKPMTIQVVALRWKWLFIYPDQKIASVNYVQFPEDTPVEFKITSDGPMNSFWIPKLGGQMYAMSGMSTELNLMADQPGIYRGSSANISGEGFAGMKFTAHSSTPGDFGAWVKDVKKLPNELGTGEYNKLARPAKNSATAYYSYVDDGLYNKVIMKYAASPEDSRQKQHAGGH